MNKSELIEAIAEQSEVTNAVAGRTLDATISAIVEELQKGGTVSLTGFGAFSVLNLSVVIVIILVLKPCAVAQFDRHNSVVIIVEKYWNFALRKRNYA